MADSKVSLPVTEKTSDAPHDCSAPKRPPIELPGGEEWGLGCGERPETFDARALRDRNRLSGGHNVA